jgi:hypothetical protein
MILLMMLDSQMYGNILVMLPKDRELDLIK